MTTKKATTKKTAEKTVKKPAKPAAKKTLKKEKVEKSVKTEKVMPVSAAKLEKKSSGEKPAHNASHSDAGRYFYSIGRRKTAVAQVRLFENDKATEDNIVVNGKKFKEYFPVAAFQNNLLSPLKAVGMQDKVNLTIIVKGGGFNGQVEAVRLGIARALVEYDEKLKKTLKDLGLLTRDSRKVERKKAGLKKARKSPQWSKR
jgi:small subunit ribosomal protein S9